MGGGRRKEREKENQHLLFIYPYLHTLVLEKEERA